MQHIECAICQWSVLVTWEDKRAPICEVCLARLGGVYPLNMAQARKRLRREAQTQDLSALYKAAKTQRKAVANAGWWDAFAERHTTGQLLITDVMSNLKKT